MHGTIRKMALEHPRQWQDTTQHRLKGVKGVKTLTNLKLFILKRELSGTLFTQGHLGTHFFTFIQQGTQRHLQPKRPISAQVDIRLCH